VAPFDPVLHSRSYNGYLSDDMSIDEFNYDNEDFVIFIANGNDGEDGYFTVGSPAVSKVRPSPRVRVSL
jgi:hypothetical protein